MTERRKHGKSHREILAKAVTSLRDDAGVQRDEESFCSSRSIGTSNLDSRGDAAAVLEPELGRSTGVYLSFGRASSFIRPGGSVRAAADGTIGIGGVRLRAFYLFRYTIARSARITKSIILTIQRCTIEREIGCDVAEF